MQNEDLMPPWISQRKNNQVGEELIKWALLIVLVIATFGLVLMFDSTNDGMKGKH